VSAILFNRTFLTRLAESENRHVVNARLETVCVAQMRAQRRHSRIIQVLNMPTGQANQVMVGWCGQQFVNGPGLAQIGLGDECQVFEPLKHTVNGGFRHRNALGFKVLLTVYHILCKRHGRAKLERLRHSRPERKNNHA
jgi:hypothetical protein